MFYGEKFVSDGVEGEVDVIKRFLINECIFYLFVVILGVVSEEVLKFFIGIFFVVGEGLVDFLERIVRFDGVVVVKVVVLDYVFIWVGDVDGSSIGI